ncbi:Hypothetical predicted protein, partial [Pelobates cultripes]
VIIPTEISNVFTDYYSSLYNFKDQTGTSPPKTEAILQYLRKLPILSLTAEHIASLSAPITEEEVKECIRGLPKGKAPGPYG